jgi:hypothetical protein
VVLAPPRDRINPGDIKEKPQNSGLSIVKKKTIPKFKTEDEEREFWATHDSTDFIDWSKAAKITFPKLKRSANKVNRKPS